MSAGKLSPGFSSGRMSYSIHIPNGLDSIRVTAAAKESLGRMEPFDAVGLGRAKVDRVASSRRIPTGDGKIIGRMSGTTNPKLQALPEGRIDPILKTITLARGDTPLVRMHYYATHPQSFYGDPRACSDVPGFARRRLEEKEGVFQIYLTGCSGDVAMGKYNDRTRRARDELTGRLYAGMEASVASTRLVPCERIEWRTLPVTLPARDDPGYTVEENRAKVVLAEAEVPRAIAEAFRSGNLGIMDYYRYKNIVADTEMRKNIAKGGEESGPVPGGGAQ